jgi:hypothetical protein
LQEQLLSDPHVPLPEQTKGLLEFIPEHWVNSHWFPVYPKLQEQLLSELQFPWPEQTFGFVLFFP